MSDHRQLVHWARLEVYVVLLASVAATSRVWLVPGVGVVDWALLVFAVGLAPAYFLAWLRLGGKTGGYIRSLRWRNNILLVGVLLVVEYGVITLFFERFALLAYLGVATCLAIQTSLTLSVLREFRGDSESHPNEGDAAKEGAGLTTQPSNRHLITGLAVVAAASLASHFLSNLPWVAVGVTIAICGVAGAVAAYARRRAPRGAAR